jgi:hypothetical protein
MCALASRNTQLAPAANPGRRLRERRKYTEAKAPKKNSPSMQLAKHQIEQELPLVVCGFDAPQIQNRVRPALADCAVR